MINYDKMKWVTLLFIFSICCTHSNAQTPDTIKNELGSVNAAYDSAFYLSFDINMVYSSDTTGNGDFDRSEIRGKYTLYKKKALYLLDNIEYMQNENYSIAVYKNDRFILVGKPKNVTGGSFLPHRQLVDSFTNYMDSLYTSRLVDSGQTRSVVFTAIDPTAAIYEKVQIDYETRSHLLKKVSYYMKETMGEYGVATVGLANARKARFVVNFSGHTVKRNGPAVFDESRYIFFRSPSDIQPSERFGGYTIYNNLNQ